MNFISIVNLISYILVFNVATSHNVHSTKKHPKIVTPLSEVELMNVISDSHEDVFGFEPSNERLSMAWAMVAFENGRGKHMWNHNVGNIGPGRDHDYYVHSNRTTYRSFQNFLDGGVAYWKTIKRCSAVLKYFDIGASKEVALQLKRCNYFGADVEIYIAGISSLYWEATGKILPIFKLGKKNEKN